MFIETKMKNQTKLRRSGMKGQPHQILVSLETIGLVPPRWGLDLVWNSCAHGSSFRFGRSCDPSRVGDFIVRIAFSRDALRGAALNTYLTSSPHSLAARAPLPLWSDRPLGRWVHRQD